MKRQNILFILGAACLLSMSSIGFVGSDLTVHAEAITADPVTFTGIRNESTSQGIYLIPESNNQIPTAWGSGDYDCAFTPVGGTGGVFVNGVDAGNRPMKKVDIGAIVYYVTIPSVPTSGTVVTIKGNWSGITKDSQEFNFTVNEFKMKWSGSIWMPEIVVPELDAYDKVTLKDAGIDDYDRETIDIFKGESAWNSFAVSPENTRKSFAFEFAYQTYETMTRHLEFRVGARGNYYSPHCYHFIINNSWGNGKGQYSLKEEYNEQPKSESGFKDFPTSINTGRHIVEFGSIYLDDDSNKTFDYVKYDGEYVYAKIITPYSHDRSTKVAMVIPEAKVFVGSTISQKERDTTLSFNRSDADKGIYLNGPVNDIPVSGWSVRAAPSVKYNALLNGEPLYQYDVGQPPLAKFNDDEDNNYYLGFVDYGLRFSDGDIITLSDEWHFFYNNVVYVLSINPISFLFNGTSFVPINSIYDYMSNSVANRCMPELYSDENLLVIEQIVNEAQSQMPLKSNMKLLWDLYLGYINQLDAVPLDEEKSEEYLRPYREAAINELNACYNPTNYTEDCLNQILGIVSAATEEINSCLSVSRINEIKLNAKTEIEAIPTKQVAIEAAILDSDELLDQYLETYDVITTSDLCASGGMTFTSNKDTSYHSGDNKDITSRFAVSEGNRDGNVVFQFNYTSTNYTSLTYSAQVSVRVRGTPDNCARFDIGTHFSTHSGVRLVINNVAIEDCDVNFVQRATPYKIECGSIDIDGFDRTLLFIKVDGQYWVKKIADKVSIVQTPTITIMDSLTTGNDTATITPIEEGTTKHTNSTVIGNLTLNEDSDKNSLQFTARNNNIPTDIMLYPMEDNAFTINGVQPVYSRPNVSISKVSPTTYSVNFDKSVLTDGTVVGIKGVYCSHNAARGIKTAYQLFEAEFVYHASTDSWSQNVPSLSIVKAEALDMLTRYVKLENYSETSQASLRDLISSCQELINQASSVNEVYSKLNEALERIDLIPTLLRDYQNAAKENLRAYASRHEYREDEQIELNYILAEAYQNIDKTDDYDDIDQIVRDAKEDIDTLKTAEERDLEDLEAEKRVARTEVEMYVGLLQLNRYSDENIALIRDLAFTARNDIENASNSEQIQNILETFKTAIKGVKTNDGSTFNGETYIEPNKQNNSGCGGNIVTTSIVLSILSLFGLMIILRKKHLRMFINK